MPSTTDPGPGLLPSPYRLGDLVDLPTFKRLLDNLFEATGIPNGVVDSNGDLLSLSAGANACTRFHRQCAGTEALCRASNLQIMGNLQAGCMAGGLCHNGLMDYATPVVLKGRLLATLFLGQVLHEAPDLAFFRAQAQRNGFDETAYLEAIQAVPVVDKARIDSLMRVMVECANLLAAGSQLRVRQTRLERDMHSHIERQVQLEDILDSSPVAIGWSNSEGHIEYINRKFTQLFGYTLSDLPDLQTWYRLAYPDTNQRHAVVAPWAEAVEAARQAGTTPPKLEVSVTCKDGGVRRVVIATSWVGSRRLVNFTDISERWKIECRQHAHDAMLEMVARGARLPLVLDALVRQMESEDETAQCSILLLDAQGRHLHNGAAPSLPAFYNEAIDGIAIGVGVGSCGTAAALGERVIVEDINTHEYWRPYVALAQAAHLRACWSEPIRSSRGQVLGTFAIYHAQAQQPLPEDIERLGFASSLAAIAIEHDRARTELELRAYSDGLTGLANRRRLFQRAEDELARRQRHGGELSLVMLDIDHFKRINDSFGHEAGDQVLRQLADICRRTLRTIDLVGRIGGEEFAMVLPQTGHVAAVEVAQRLRAAIAAKPVVLDDGREVAFTASMGVATCGEGAQPSVNQLLADADKALYRAKELGRNRVCG